MPEVRAQPIQRQELLKKSVADIFDDVQKSTVLHRKNALALRKIQERCSMNGEQAFNKAILEMVPKILSVKKKEPCVDRTIKFLGAFIQYTSEKGNSIVLPSGEC